MALASLIYHPLKVAVGLSTFLGHNVLWLLQLHRAYPSAGLDEWGIMW